MISSSNFFEIAHRKMDRLSEVVNFAEEFSFFLPIRRE